MLLSLRRRWVELRGCLNSNSNSSSRKMHSTLWTSSRHKISRSKTFLEEWIWTINSLLHSSRTNLLSWTSSSLSNNSRRSPNNSNQWVSSRPPINLPLWVNSSLSNSNSSHRCNSRTHSVWCNRIANHSKTTWWVHRLHSKICSKALTSIRLSHNSNLICSTV